MTTYHALHLPLWEVSIPASRGKRRGKEPFEQKLLLLNEQPLLLRTIQTGMLTGDLFWATIGSVVLARQDIHENTKNDAKQTCKFGIEADRVRTEGQSRVNEAFRLQGGGGIHIPQLWYY